MILEIGAILQVGERYLNGAEFSKSALLPLFRAKAELQRVKLTGESRINVRQELGALRDSIELELQAKYFAFISPAVSEYFEQEKLFGDEVHTRFPEARQDIKDAGNCLAASLPTASVFHSMRAAEYGLRRLAKRLRVRLTHSGKRQPIEFADWNQVIQAIRAKISKAHTLPRGQKKQATLEALSKAMERCECMKEIWRNPVSHTRTTYKESQAVDALNDVQDFMVFLETYL